MAYAARCAAYRQRASRSLEEWAPALDAAASTEVAPKKVKKKSKSTKVKSPFPASLNVCRAHLGLPLVAELLEHQVPRTQLLIHYYRYIFGSSSHLIH
jgi:hypothetical protein